MEAADAASGTASARAVVSQVADSAWGDRLLRAGLAARGLVFLIFGVLVARVALGALGEPSTSKPAQVTGVPQALAAEPGGRPMLVVLALGMILYAAFSLVDAIRHHDDEEPGAKRWADRALSVWGFVMYAGLAAYSFDLAVSGSTDTSARDNRQKALWTADVLRWPAGQFWLGFLAILLLGAAAFLVSRAARRSFRPRLERARMSSCTWRFAMVLGTVGYLGRAVLFAVVGGCVLSAAIENDPRHGQGVDGSLRIVVGASAGEALLWMLVLMLVAYAGYMFIETGYRKV